MTSERKGGEAVRTQRRMTTPNNSPCVARVKHALQRRGGRDAATKYTDGAPFCVVTAFGFTATTQADILADLRRLPFVIDAMSLEDAVDVRVRLVHPDLVDLNSMQCIGIALMSMAVAMIFFMP